MPIENLKLDEHKPNAEETVNLIKEHSYQEGYQLGFDKGLFEGAAQTKAQMMDKTNTLNALLQTIPDAISDNREQIATEIADIVLTITQQFFIYQQQNHEAIAKQVMQIITQINDKQNIDISLHPQDIALIQEGKINIDVKECKNIRIIPDENLRLGGCVIQSKHGLFDASIERQIDNLKQVLLQIKHGGHP